MKIEKFTLICLSILSILAACKPVYPPNKKPSIESTISSDGRVVAVLGGDDHKDQKLKVLNLDDGKGWVELPLPMYTTSVRFGLQGHNLLLTHRIPGEGINSQLTKWNIDDLAMESDALYEGNMLDFPLQISSTEYLVRTCKPYEHEKVCKNGGTYFWVLVDSNKNATKVGPKANAYEQPNLYGRGIFWVVEAEDLSHPGIDKANDKHMPRVLSYALPNGNAPVLDSSKLRYGTTDFSCDKQMKRCLRKYNKNDEEDLKGRFIYDVEIFFGEEHCRPESLSGYIDGLSITPTGNAAVVSLASAYDQPRHVVVLKFDGNRCMPSSIQHLTFKGE